MYFYSEPASPLMRDGEVPRVDAEK
jgi:hypothetical protein